MKDEICFILDWYPTQKNNGCVFAKHLICAIADMGYRCVVIAPRIIHPNSFRKENQVSYKRVEKTVSGNEIQIYAPFYVHLSSSKKTMKYSMENHYKAVMRTLKKEHISPDIIYGHFIYQCGLTAARVGKKLGIPAYCAAGENSLRLENGRGPYATGLKYCDWKNILSCLDGIVCVSSNNKKLLRQSGLVTSEMRMEVFPNGVDENKFYLMNRKEVRLELKLPEEAFIVVYTGAFTENKGADRLNEALKQCGNVYALFLGSGSVDLDCERILFAGKIANDSVNKYLNAADVFVLPTRGEGCSNAIVEALVCGLPVISSNQPFNDDILNEQNSIRINVESVEEIKEAICLLRDDRQLRYKLAQGALKTGQSLNICERAKKILQFMNYTESSNGK